jgi:hypothetical protein
MSAIHIRNEGKDSEHVEDDQDLADQPAEVEISHDEAI